MPAWFGMRLIGCLMVVGVTIAVLQTRAQTFVFAELKGTPINTAGWNMQGIAQPGGAAGEELVLTPAINTQSGAIFYNTPINLSRCNKWIAEFDFRIADGTAADGIAFCYLDVPPTGFVTGGGVGIPATANGLKIVLDTWRNCNTDAVPKIQIRWGLSYDECNGQPTRNNNDGALNFIRNGNYHTCKVEYDNGAITVFINGIQYLTGNQTFDFTGYFGFTASTGGSNDRHSIKNVRIFTEMPTSVSGADSIGLCPGQTAQLGTAPTNGLMYSWRPTTRLNDPNIANPIVSSPVGNTVYEPITYFVQTEFANKPGCGSRDSVLVKNFAKPLPNFSASIACLPNGKVDFKNSTTLNGSPFGSGNWQWLWNFGDPSADASNPNTSVISDPSHTYNSQNPAVSLSVVSPDGCPADTSIIVSSIYKRPVASFSTASPTCTNQNVQFSQTVSDANGTNAPIDAFWDFGDGQTIVADKPAHNYISSGNYLVKMVARHRSSGCNSDTVTKIITVTTSPTANFNRTGKLCLDSLQTLTDISQPGFSPLASRQWSFSDGTTSSLAVVQKPIAFSGNYVATLTVTDNNGCFNTKTDTLTAAPAPTAIFGAFAPCINNPTEVAALAGSLWNWQNFNFEDLRLKWTFNDPASSTANPDTVSGRQVGHRFVNRGIYNIRLLMTDPQGCAYDTVFNLAIDSLPSTNFSIATPNALCSNRVIFLTNLTGTKAVSTSIFVNYPAAEFYDAANKPLAFGDTARLWYNSTAQTQLLVKMVNTFANTCTSEKLDTLRFLRLPVVEFDALPPLCANAGAINLTAYSLETTGLQGVSSYYGKGVTNSTFVPAAATVGTQPLYAVFAANNGCRDTATTTARVFEVPMVSAGPDKIVLPGGQTTLDGQSSLPAQRINWIPNTFLNNPTTLRPVSVPSADVSYVLEVETADGCKNSDAVIVTVLPKLTVPSAFSPNGDGINDIWTIRSLDSYPGCTVEMFDRYGQKIWNSIGYNTPWDGTRQGKPVAAGVYYFVINPKNGAAAFTGSVTLLR